MTPKTLFDETIIRREVFRILEDMTEDWDFDYSGGITGETRLVEDLGFESMDFVMLIISVEERFHRKNLPFEDILTSNGKFVGEVTANQIVGMLVNNLT